MIVLRSGYHCLTVAWVLFISTLLCLFILSLRSASNNIHNTAYKWLENVKIGSAPAYRLHRWPSFLSAKNSSDARAAISIPTVSTAHAIAVTESLTYRNQVEYDRDLLRLLSQVGSESKKRGITINEELLVAAIIKLKIKHNYPKNTDGSWKLPEEYVLGSDGKVRLAPVTQRLNLRGPGSVSEEGTSGRGSGGSSGSNTDNAMGAGDPAKEDPDPVFDSTSGTLIDKSAQSAIALVNTLTTQREAFLEVEKKMKHAQHALKKMEREKQSDIERGQKDAGPHGGEPKGTATTEQHKQNGASISISESTHAIVLSTGRPATSDVRGNLGEANVITSEKMDDWLADRWQAASNMGGKPIPGMHWVEVDLQRLCKVSSILIDWEEAFSQHWTLQGKRSDGKCAALSSGGDEGWVAIARSSEAFKPPFAPKYTPKHILQAVKIRDGHTGNGDKDDCSAPHYDKVRLVISKPSTRFGSSIWRLQIHGFEVL